MNVGRIWKWIATVALILDKIDDIVRAIKGLFKKPDPDPPQPDPPEE